MSDWFSTNGLLAALVLMVFIVGYALAKTMDQLLVEFRSIRRLLAEIVSSDNHAQLLTRIEDVRMEIRTVRWFAEKATGISAEELSEARRRTHDEQFRRRWKERFPDADTGETS